jgi:uroporphyrinogen-III synthase
MSTKRKSVMKRSLSDVRVLVGRARHQASALSAELRKHGAQVLEVPFIEIRKPRSFHALDTALKNLESYDWLILTSVNGVGSMWERMEKLGLVAKTRNKITASGPLNGLRIAAIGPATKKAMEQRGANVDVMPKEYIAESVVRSLKGKVKGKRILLVRAKVARDVIPRELRNAGARVDVVEAYETVVPKSSRRRLQAALNNPKQRPNVVTFTSSSTVKNFVELLGARGKSRMLEGVQMASIGPVTSATLRAYGLGVDIAAREFTIPGLVAAILQAIAPVSH